MSTFALGGETVAKGHFWEIFVEDGALKSITWGRQEVAEQTEDEVQWNYRLNSIKLDQQGALVWTGRSHSSKLTLLFTIRTKRIPNAESSLVVISRSLLNALPPLGGCLLIWDLLRYACGIWPFAVCL